MKNRKSLNSGLHIDSSFDLSFDKNVLKNWLGLQTIARGIPASVPQCDVVATAFNRGSQDLFFILSFVTQFIVSRFLWFIVSTFTSLF